MGLDAIITRLPKGYDTQVGDRNIEYLPQGVIQFICIARALANDPKIILFDEANMGVDIQADKAIKELLLSLKPNHTIVLVSHRPSLLAISDKIFALNKGKLVEQISE